MQFDRAWSKMPKRSWVVAVLAGWALALCGAGASKVSGSLPETAGTDVHSLTELRDAVSREGRALRSIHIKAIVCAVLPGRNLLALQDDSTAILLEVPKLDEVIRAGDWVSVEASHCTITRSWSGIQLGTAPVVNNDGRHPAMVKSGQVFLEQGLQPIRVTWFNGYGESMLQVEYEGPGLERQKIPDTALWRRCVGNSVSASFQPGLDFISYNTGTEFLPNFRRLTPVTQGVAGNFDLQYRTRKEDTALAFNGYLKVPCSGIYTFYVNSDDGAYLYAGNAAASCKVTVLDHKTTPLIPRRLEESLAGRWTKVEGSVTFVGQNEQGLIMELAGEGGPVQISVVDGSLLLRKNLLHGQIRALGILETLPDFEKSRKARLIVPGQEQIEIHDSKGDTFPTDTTPDPVLSTAEQVRHLTLADAGRHLPAKIRGVIIWNSPTAVVLQDATGGIYIHYFAPDWVEQPRVGDCWEIEGTTDPGDFSPVIDARAGKFIGGAAMPEPIHPTWQQLLNGSLDAEYVELRGALTAISAKEMTLLTSEGKIKIETMDDRPLPKLPEPDEDSRSYLDGIVRIRGCMTAHWEKATRQARAGEIFLCPSTVEMEEFAPSDPFELATRRTSDLLTFDPGASTLQRTKIKGQVVFARTGEYCVQDGSVGFRLWPKQATLLHPGDLVEAVGFPKLGGPSPVLQEARVRSTGSLPLPAPVPVSAVELLDRNHDSTRVQVEALLMDDRMMHGERVLELQAGQSHFIARLIPGPPGLKPLEAGSRLQVSGVYFSLGNEQVGGNLDAFELWLNSPADIRLLQRPPWWTLRRALTVVTILSGVLGAALIWITLLRRKVEERTLQLKRQIEQRQVVEQRRIMEQERTRVAQDLHDELGAGLTEVGLLGDLVKNPAVPAKEKLQYLDQMTHTARSLVVSLDEIVWAVNPCYDSVASVVSYYTLFAQRFLNLAGVACRPQIPASFPEYPLDPKERHGLFLAFKEALNNVVRHSGATEVRLKIEIGEGELIFSISDNGRGFEPATASGEGEGLKGMRRRLENLGGSCEIRSRPGAGTEVELRLPVGKPAYD